MRADRLLSLVLLLQARGGMTAQALAAELEVSVRTVYRDLEALAAAGVPVLAQSGPGGGCQLMEGYRFPLRGLRPDEAEALLILGVPGVLRELGLDQALGAAHRQIRLSAGFGEAAGGGPGQEGHGAALVHLDMPRWFSGGAEEVPCLRDLASALRLGRRVALRYERPGAQAGERGGGEPGGGERSGGEPRGDERRVVGPLGLVNKAGTWYLVASPAATAEAVVAGKPGAAAEVTQAGEDADNADPVEARAIRVFRAGRITSVQVLAEAFERPGGFDLAAFWEQWSAEFAASRPRIPVQVRASPAALAAFGEIFGQAVGQALEAAETADEHGWRVVTLSFEHEVAAAHRLAGFGDQVEVLTPPAVRARLVDTARQILRRYDAQD
ncbi:MAG: helix-turn-helix transcriptional regulator [Streptosporangiaceae bacterium]